MRSNSSGQPPVARSTLLALILVASVISNSPTQAEVTRASHWIDRVVLTNEGELLGRVEDLALDQDSLTVRYLVVSVGSYLIEENLIAVSPQTLTESDNGEYLVIPAQTLADAPRFSADAWPDEAQIDMPQAKRAPRSAAAPSTPGVAEIVGSRKKLTMDRDGQKSVTDLTPAPQVVADPVEPKNLQQGIHQDEVGNRAALSRYDTNADGYLSPSEVGPYLSPGMRFNDFDSDGNGGLDAFELMVLKEQQ
ncbi:MAG: PRC-barrel domain-containing protein [Pseudomonadota bacterium]